MTLSFAALNSPSTSNPFWQARYYFTWMCGIKLKTFALSQGNPLEQIQLLSCIIMKDAYTFAPTKQPKYSCKSDVNLQMEWEKVCGFSNLTEQPFCQSTNKEKNICNLFSIIFFYYCKIMVVPFPFTRWTLAKRSFTSTLLYLIKIPNNRCQCSPSGIVGLSHSILIWGDIQVYRKLDTALKR